LVTEFIVTVRVLPPDTTDVVIVIRREEELESTQLDATEHEHVVELESVTSAGTLIKINELEMRELAVVNASV
jgi:hypothetical protein